MNRRGLLRSGLAGVLGPLFARAANAASAEGHELIGTPAPPLELKHWIHSRPLDWKDLRGKVVLLRWWTDGCPYCEATGPALRELQRKYGPAGLQVIGIYHPKPPGNWDVQKMSTAADEKKFTFPVALDGDWTALKRWWLNRDRDFTSVSFIVDQTGIIRYIHPGGEFHEGNVGGLAEHIACQRSYHEIDAKIGQLLTA